MGRELIKRWKLAVLRVSLDLSARPPVVASRLDGYASGSDVTYWRRTDPLHSFGLASSADVPTRVTLPEPLVVAIQETMSHELRGDSALWLRLEPPYGYLGAAPWEDLADNIDVPVFRVPDRLPTPTALGRTWRVALAVSAPRDAQWGAQHVRNFTTALRESFDDRRVEVDVFADIHTYGLLVREPGSSQGMIRAHDPAGAHDAHEWRTTQSQGGPQRRRTSGLRIFEPTDDARLIWADWMTSGLAGVAVHALHVASTGLINADRPMLAISPDPSRSVPLSSCTSVDTDDLRTLADNLGATVVSIAAPETRGSDVGARMVADSLGQMRPGPTLYTSLRRDPTSRALADIYAFLADPAGRDLPSDPSWFGYIQPESIQDAAMEPLLPHHTGQEASVTTWSRGLTMGVFPASRRDDALAEKFRNADEVPTWVASSSRFVEAQYADLSNLSATPGEGKASKHAYDIGTSEALADIEALVQRHLDK